MISAKLLTSKSSFGWEFDAVGPPTETGGLPPIRLDSMISSRDLSGGVFEAFGPEDDAACAASDTDLAETAVVPAGPFGRVLPLPLLAFAAVFMRTAPPAR